MAKPLNQKCKELTEEERLSWNGHKIVFGQFARSSMVIILALADCKKRELYREEYGAGKKGWHRFIAEAPWFSAHDWTRQRKNQFKQAVQEVEQLSTRVDGALLAGLSEYTIRALRSTVQNPVWRGELVNFMVEQGVKLEDINEASIDRYYPRFLQAKEDEEEKCKIEAQIGVPKVESEEWTQDEEKKQEEEQISTQSADEKAVRHAAGKTQKRGDYFGRLIDYGRLLVKNGRKVDQIDLETKEALDTVRGLIPQLDELLSYLRSLVAATEAA